MRVSARFLARWKWLIVAALALYAVISIVPLPRGDAQLELRPEPKIINDGEKFDDMRQIEKLSKEFRPRPVPKVKQPAAVEINELEPKKVEKEQRVEEKKKEEEEKKEATELSGDTYALKKTDGSQLLIEKVLTLDVVSMKERMRCDAPKNPPKKKLMLSWNAGHSAANLGGCPDWHCEFTNDRKRSDEADAVIMLNYDYSFKRRDSDQYVIYFSQESPKNSGWGNPAPDFFNMSIGYRHSTAAASPYGYTVKLAKEAFKKKPLISSSVVRGKKKNAAWFVSHCGTNSKREHLVEAMKKLGFPVDVYGACGPLSCLKGTDCESKALNDDYYFYIAFENSICADYNTEKLWHQGYMYDIIPVVLKRSIAEPFVPPNSFIAVDDFPTVQKLIEHLEYLKTNETAYMEYFSWRRDHQVVFLDGKNHDDMERPWGFCQICRMMWNTDPVSRQARIPDFNKWWEGSCENDGDLVMTLLANSGVNGTTGYVLKP